MRLHQLDWGVRANEWRVGGRVHAVPAKAGGKLYSDGIVRAVFIMFLLFSVPVGLHHQFSDPGVDDGLKFVHTILTFLVFFPSMVTAFAPGYVFAFFCFMMVLQLLWVKLAVPETKGQPLEQIEHQLGGLDS